jgi:Zn finger protein HypA/HybF involved in hydrogenase expression
MKVRLGKTLKCQRCGKVWLPRKPEVRICPTCKSSYWDVPKAKAS